MTQRFSLYRDIHKAIRAMMLDLVQKSGRLDFSDAEALGQFRAEARNAVEFLFLHAEKENTFVAPVLAEIDAELNQRINGAHPAQDRELEELLADLSAIDPRSPDATVKGHEFVVKLSQITGTFFVHMAEEEEEIMPALWAALDDAALQAIHGRIMASIRPDHLAQALSWMLPAITGRDRVAMLTGIRATAPAPVFAFVRDLARSVLSPSDHAALETALA